MSYIPQLLCLTLALMATSPIPAHAKPTSMLDLGSDDFRGCIAVSPKGKKMACINVIGGRAGLEIKAIAHRRVYNIDLLGAPSTPDDATTTPKKVLKKILKKLQRKKYIPLAQGTRTPQGFTVPRSRCTLTISKDNVLVNTISEGRNRGWLLTGGPGGVVSLVAVATHPTDNQLFVVLGHATENGEIHTQQIKVLKLSDLNERKECGPVEKPTDTQKEP